MRNHRYIIFLMMIAAHIMQGTSECYSQPLPPVLDNVTVNNQSASATLTWTASPSSGVAGYVIYRYRNNEGYAVDTLWNPSSLTFTDYSTGALFFSESYVVAAIDNELNISPLSNPLGTVFLTADLDTCNNKIDISWSEYTPVNTTVTAYEVYASEEGGEFMKIFTATQAGQTFEWTAFETDRSYLLMVQAVMADNSVSLSNWVSVLTDIEKPPAWLQISNITVNSSDQIEVSVSYDPQSELDNFRILRKEEEGDYVTTVSIRSTGGSFNITDSQVTTNRRYSYIAEVINNCGTPLISSHPAGNIVLSYELSDPVLLFRWNQYTGWAQGVEEYLLQYHTGDAYFMEMARLSPSDSSYAIDYRNLIYEITGAETCFRLTALSAISDGGIYESVSNTVCLEGPESFYMPNAFTPDGNGLNDYFGPVMAFTPTEYLMIVRNREGRILFRTDKYTEQWDGTLKGEKLPPDVYLWFLRIKTPSGQAKEMTGTVALIYNN